MVEPLPWIHQPAHMEELLSSLTSGRRISPGNIRKMTTPEGVRTWEIHTMAPPEDDVYLVIGNTGIHAPTSRQVANVAKMLEKIPRDLERLKQLGESPVEGLQH